MRTIEIGLAETVSAVDVERALAVTCAEMGLRIGLKSTLASYPGSLHWHLTREDQRGTLEVTFVPQPTRMWIAVHANRQSSWTDEAVARFPVLLQRSLAQPASEETT